METAGLLATSVPGVAIGANPISGGTPGITGSLQTGYLLTSHRILSGTNAGDRFGHAIAFVGNLDGVAGDEFLVGAPQWQSELPGFTTKGPGYARLFSMGSPNWLIQLDGTQPISGTPPRDGEAFGFSVAGNVDLSVPSDGVPDLLIGSPLFNVGEITPGAGMVHAGRVRAFSGAAAAQNVESLIADNGAPDHTHMVGVAGSDQFGYSVAGVDDLDGDTRDEVIVGAWQAGIDLASLCVAVSPPPRVAQGGSATVFSLAGANPSIPLAVFYGEKYRDHMGRAVAATDLFGSSGRVEVILSGVAWTEEGAVAPHTEHGKGYVWDGDTVAP